MKKSTDEVVEFKMVFVIFIAFLIPITNTMHGNFHNKISLFNITESQEFIHVFEFGTNFWNYDGIQIVEIFCRIFHGIFLDFYWLIV